MQLRRPGAARPGTSLPQLQLSIPYLLTRAASYAAAAVEREERQGIGTKEHALAFGLVRQGLLVALLSCC